MVLGKKRPAGRVVAWGNVVVYNPMRSERVRRTSSVSDVELDKTIGFRSDATSVVAAMNFQRSFAVGDAPRFPSRGILP